MTQRPSFFRRPATSLVASIRRLLPLCLAVAVSFAPSRAEAQMPSIPGITSPASPTAEAGVQAEETREQQTERLQTWLQEANEALVRLEDPTLEASLPEGINATSLTNRRRNLEQTVLSINRHLKLLAEEENIRRALEQAREETADWTGFREEPPYSILALDALLNRREAIEERAATFRSSIDLFERTLASIVRDATTAETAAREAREALEASGGANEAARWRLESARISTRFQAARAGASRDQVAILNLQLDTAAAELALIERQIEVISDQVEFSDEDLETVTKASADRTAAMRQDLLTLASRQRAANAARDRAQTTLERLIAEEAEGPEAVENGAPDPVELARLRLQTAEHRIESLQSMAEILESQIQLESFTPEAYQYRKALLEPDDNGSHDTALESLENLVDRLRAWEVVSNNLATAVASDLSGIDSRASAISSEDPRLALFNEQRSIAWERHSLIQRVTQSASTQRRLVQRWIADFLGPEVEPAWYQKIGGYFVAAKDAVVRFWNIDVLSYEESFTFDDQTITDTKTVKLGKLLGALVFFVVIYLIASSVSKRLQRLVVRRAHVGEAQANTLRNWLMIVVAGVLALWTLNLLKVPLTVFAFLGGALAIGLGFGTQTLIKNFISGVILLFERKIRVGDIIQVDGLLGVISEINTRSSVLRGFDGVETMIPNSIFLENRATNWTLNDRRLRRELRVGVAYGTPPQKVIEVLNEAVARHGLVLKDPAPFSFFEDFGDSSLVFACFFWVELNDRTNAVLVMSDLRIMIDKRLNELGIGIPFPQRDIHLNLSEPLPVSITKTEVEKEDAATKDASSKKASPTEPNEEPAATKDPTPARKLP